MKKLILTPVILAVMAVSACGSAPKPAGPDVTGMNLMDAKKTLKKHNVNVTVHSDALFGVLVEQNFIVCKDVAVNKRMVRLEVSKGECS